MANGKSFFSVGPRRHYNAVPSAVPFAVPSAVPPIPLISLCGRLCKALIPCTGKSNLTIGNSTALFDSEVAFLSLNIERQGRREVLKTCRANLISSTRLSSNVTLFFETRTRC